MKGGRGGGGAGVEDVRCLILEIRGHIEPRQTENECTLDAQAFKNLTSKIESDFLAGTVENDWRGVNT